MNGNVKCIIKMFKTAGLNITNPVGLRIINFLDVQFSSSNGSYQPYRKTGNASMYISKNSSQPSVVLKQLPKSIAKRISDISSDEIVFSNSIPTYSEVLSKSGFNETLTYNPKATDCDNSGKKTQKSSYMV